MKLVSIAIFGVVGVMARYGVGVWLRQAESVWPATFAINIVGAFLIGVTYVIGVQHQLLSEEWRLGVMVGLLGGFTTFSSYCLEFLTMAEAGKIWLACAYLFASPVAGVLAASAGMSLAKSFL